MSLLEHVALCRIDEKSNPQTLQRFGADTSASFPEQLPFFAFPVWCINKLDGAQTKSSDFVPPNASYPFVTEGRGGSKLYCATFVFHTAGPRAICVTSRFPLLRTLVACVAALYAAYEAAGQTEAALKVLATGALNCREPLPPGIAVSQLTIGEMKLCSQVSGEKSS